MERAISGAECGEKATLRRSEFNAPTKMFHDLKDRFEELRMKKAREASSAAEWRSERSDDEFVVRTHQGQDET